MATMSTCPPWLTDDGKTLVKRARGGRLPHAILLAGVAGIGKQVFAQWLAEVLLCRQPIESGACGECESCLQLQARAHPDFRKLIPEGANAAIKVDPVRDLVAWLHLTAGQDSYRVAVLEQADAMNRNAANSLLKTLEEPGENNVLILTASRSGALPATVRSRCQTINLKLRDRSVAIDWLAQRLEHPEAALSDTAGGPFAALATQDDSWLAARELLLKAWRDLFLRKGSVGRISDSLASLETTLCLATFSRWALLAAKQRSGLVIDGHPAVVTAVADTHERLSLESWITVHGRLLQLHRSDSASFKTQTVLEGILADTRLMNNG